MLFNLKENIKMAKIIKDILTKPIFEKEDMVNKPIHYNQYGIECIDSIRASMSDLEFHGYLKGNVEKYLWRYNYKSKPKEDLQKAQWYLNKLIEVL